MRAIVYDRYGPPDVLRLADRPRPEPGPGEVLVRVRAAPVTTADWRMRAAAYPGALWLPGRLITGLFRPRHPVLGVAFAGEVAAVGTGVTRFRPGARVFGFSGRGAYAEYLVMPETGAIADTPAALADPEAAALPFGALSALVFLRDIAHLVPGQSIAVIGATGGVGIYAVQIAKALGARVTGVAGAAHQDFVRDIGADRAVDYRAEDVTAGTETFDVIFDTVGALDYTKACRALTAGGVFVPLNFGFREMVQALWARLTGGPRLAIATSGDTAADLEVLAAMIAAGDLRPIVERCYPLDKAAAAHAEVETRHRRGVIVLSPI